MTQVNGQLPVEEPLVQKVLWAKLKKSKAIWSYSLWEHKLSTDHKSTAVL